MNNRYFLIYMLILALANAGTTLVYFSQMYLLYDYFEPDTVYVATISLAYLAQGLGLFLFMILFKTKPRVFGKRFVLSGVLISFIPISLLTVQIHSGNLLMTLLLMTNILIGFTLGFCFTNIAALISYEHIGLCWGAAYAIGNILSWLVSQLNESIITSLIIVPILCLIIGITLIPSILGENLPVHPMCVSKEEIKQNPLFLWTIFIIILMTVIYTIGSTDYSMIADTKTTSSTFYTRCFYAAGLLIAGYLYDKSHSLSAILALASVVYPIMAFMLIKASIQINLVYCFSFFTLAFFAVYRACTFISFSSNRRNCLYLACFGLLISRIIEGIIALFNVPLADSEYAGFLIVGFLFIPLIIGFCMMILNQKAKSAPRSQEEKIAELSEQHHLTRRETEIITLIIQGSTNGEIAEALTISTATARFHVSNVLKKTECKSRNDIINKYQKMH